MSIVNITFRFSFVSAGFLQSYLDTNYVGVGESSDLAIADAWQKMAADEFKRNLIFKTFSITIKEI